MIHRLETPAAIKEHRMPALDGLRGWAVLAVMFYHFALPLLDRVHDRASWATMRILLTGSYGVDMFFVLSGFLITGILLDSKSDPRYFRTFYMRRVLRIFPLYYGVLAVCFGLLFWMPIMRPFIPHQGWLWLYGANFTHLIGLDLEPLFSHFWSLAVEEHFYVAWPIVVLLLNRRSLMLTCAGLMAFSLVVRCGLIAGGWFDAETAALMTPCRLEGLTMGALVAAIARGPGGLDAFLRPAVALAVVGGFATLVIKAIHGSSESSMWGMSGVGHFTISVAVAGILTLAVVGNGFWTRILSHPSLRFFGKYSYGLYVYHYLLQPWMTERFWFIEQLPPLSLGLHVLILTGVTVLVAMLSWHAYEKQFLKLKRLFEYAPVVVPATDLPAIDQSSVTVLPAIN